MKQQCTLFSAKRSEPAKGCQIGEADQREGFENLTFKVERHSTDYFITTEFVLTITSSALPPFPIKVRIRKWLKIYYDLEHSP